MGYFCFIHSLINMVNLTPKKELAIQLIILFVIIGLILSVYINGRKLDCNNCKINFKAFKRELGANNELQEDFQVEASTLYKNLKDDHCILTFDNEGYKFNMRKEE